MKMSTKARYGLYVSVQLAKAYESGEYLQVPYLSKATGVTDGYLEQIMALLKKENIVLSQRGATGGYRLAVSPSEISVGRILRAVEDNLVFVDCLFDGCNKSDVCVSHGLWNGLYKVINDYLDSVSLKQLTEEGDVR